METAVIWGYVLVSIVPASPEVAPWMAFDYKTEATCESDKVALVEKLPERVAWCIAVPKPDTPVRQHRRRYARR